MSDLSVGKHPFKASLYLDVIHRLALSGLLGKTFQVVASSCEALEERVLVATLDAHAPVKTKIIVFNCCR